MIDLPKWAIQAALGAVAVVALIMALSLTGWRFDPFNRARADKEGRAVAEAQSNLNAGATKTVEHVLRTETIVQSRAEEATHAIVTSPGAETPFTGPIRDNWRAGINGMRESTAPGSDPRP